MPKRILSVFSTGNLKPLHETPPAKLLENGVLDGRLAQELGLAQRSDCAGLAALYRRTKHKVPRVALPREVRVALARDDSSSGDGVHMHEKPRSGTDRGSCENSKRSEVELHAQLQDAWIAGSQDGEEVGTAKAVGSG